MSKTESTDFNQQQKKRKLDEMVILNILCCPTQPMTM